MDFRAADHSDDAIPLTDLLGFAPEVQTALAAAEQHAGEFRSTVWRLNTRMANIFCFLQQVISPRLFTWGVFLITTVTLGTAHLRTQSLVEQYVQAQRQSHEALQALGRLLIRRETCPDPEVRHAKQPAKNRNYCVDLRPAVFFATRLTDLFSFGALPRNLPSVCLSPATTFRLGHF